MLCGHPTKGYLRLLAGCIAFFLLGVTQGLPGVHGFHAGNEWVFHYPVREGDRVRVEDSFVGLEARSSEFASRTVVEYQYCEYFNQQETLLAHAYTWLFRAERRAARRRRKYSKYQLPHPWKEAELKRIEDAVLSKKPRGSEPLYWEDVNVGDDLPPLVKGPFGMTDVIAYCVGADPVGLKAFKSSLEFYRAHPAWAVRDPTSHALEPIYAVHYNMAVAKAAGLPYPYDIGIQRQCWLIQLLTDYIGDEGWLIRNYAEYRRFYFYSDVIWLKGKVVRKYVSDEKEPVIYVETHATNQRGEDIMPGYSTIALPSRKHDYWPVKARLRKKVGMR